MNEDKLKGKVNDVKGRAKRQAGEWTDDSRLQAEGAADQLKGKAQKAWGDLKDGAEKLKDDANREVGREEGRMDERRKRDDNAA